MSRSKTAHKNEGWQQCKALSLDALYSGGERVVYRGRAIPLIGLTSVNPTMLLCVRVALLPPLVVDDGLTGAILSR